MPQIELIIPRMGEAIEEATILNWVKQEGDQIESDETILEIATDKVDSEVPSPVSGTLTKVLFQEGDVVAVGAVVAYIEAGEGADVPSTAVSSNNERAEKRSQKAAIAAQENVTVDFENTTKFFSPLVKNIAKQEGLSLEELEQISGTGKDGRVTKSDILTHLSSKRNGRNQKQAQKQKKVFDTTLHQKPKVFISGDDEIVEMDRMRKLIADHMVLSKKTSPHVSSFVEADVTIIVEWRNKVKLAFQEKHNEKITFTPIFLEAVAKAITDFPLINVQVDENKIILKRRINLGMATALPSGNLIVPVINDTDKLNIVELSKKANDLAARSRENKLKPEEIQGGTFTVSNIGTFDNIMGVPIINQPQVAILALGSIKKKPAVLETPQGDVIGIRHKMYLSMSYDHRVVDGILGGSFLKRIADYLEQFDTNRAI